jgi:hypothetical protein
MRYCRVKQEHCHCKPNERQDLMKRYSDGVKINIIIDNVNA